MKQKLQNKFIEEYINRGFRYGGMIPFYNLKEEGFEMDLINQLREEGFIQIRNCEDYSFELTIAERKKINEIVDLSTKWYSLESASAYQSEIENELRRIMN